MVVNSAPDLDGMPATSYPIAATEAPSTPKEPEPKTPKPSTIKIQSPPAKSQPEEEKKDETAVLALRQASAQAASKAKNKTDDKKDATAKPESEETESTSPTTRHRKSSVAPEMPEEHESPKGAKRPPLKVPEIAAVSSANFHADNAEMLGLVGHHRGSIISVTDKEEQDKVVKEIRSSISAEDPKGSLEALRKEAAMKTQPTETIEESPIGEDIETTKAEAEAKEKKEKEAIETQKDTATEITEKDTTKSEEKDASETKDKDAKGETEATALVHADPAAAESAEATSAIE